MACRHTNCLHVYFYDISIPIEVLTDCYGLDNLVLYVQLRPQWPIHILALVAVVRLSASFIVGYPTVCFLLRKLLASTRFYHFSQRIVGSDVARSQKGSIESGVLRDSRTDCHMSYRNRFP